MSVTLYFVKHTYRKALIQEVEAEKVTEKSVWIKTTYHSGTEKIVRTLRRTSYGNYFDTKQEAIEYLETNYSIEMQGLILNMGILKQKIKQLQAYKDA